MGGVDCSSDCLARLSDNNQNENPQDQNDSGSTARNDPRRRCSHTFSRLGFGGATRCTPQGVSFTWKSIRDNMYICNIFSHMHAYMRTDIDTAIQQAFGETCTAQSRQVGFLNRWRWPLLGARSTGSSQKGVRTQGPGCRAWTWDCSPRAPNQPSWF